MLDNRDKIKSNINNKKSIISNIKPKITKSPSNINNIKTNQNKKEWTQMLLKYFTTINSIDNLIEKIRSELNNIKNFSSINLFNNLDKKSKKFLTLNDFKIFLQNNNISFSEKNLRKFIHNFDKDNDFSLNYNEFLGIISPKKEEIKKDVIGEPTTVDGDNLITDEIKKKFGELLSEELKFVEKCYEVTKNIRNCNEFTTYEAFREIVKDEKYINLENLGNYLKNKGTGMTDVEIKQLMFRIDSDNDGKISYEEFKDIFLPLNDIDFKYNDNNNSYNDYYNEEKYENYNDKNSRNYKIDLPLKIPKLDLNLYNNYYSNENKENNKNEININNKYIYNTNIENIEIKDNKYIYYTNIENIDIKDNKTNYNNEIEDMPNISYSLYDEKMKNNKSIIIEPQNKDKDKTKDVKDESIYQKNTISLLSSINDNNKIKNNYINSNNDNSLLYQTKSILNYNNNNYSKKISINNYNKNTINKNEYDSNYYIKSSLKNEIKYDKKNKIIKRGKLLDTYLNYDYSRDTNKDKNNGQYYFKQKNKNESLRKNKNNINYNKNSNRNIEKNYFKKYLIDYEDDQSNYYQNDNNNIYNDEFLLENKNNSEKDNNYLNYDLNNIKLKNKKNNNYKYIIEENEYKKSIYNNNDDSDNSINQYKIVNNYNKYISNSNNIKNNSLYKKIKINQKKLNINNNPLKSNYISNNHDIKQHNDSQQYIDSLENSEVANIGRNSQILKKSKNQYHYNSKLTRNLQRHIHNRINNSYKMSNNSMTNFNYKDNINNFSNTYFANERKDNQNRSCIISYDNDKSDLFDIDNKYKKSIDYNKDKDNREYCSNCIGKRCPKCNCFQATINSEDDNNDNYDSYYSNNRNIFDIINQKNIKNRNNKHSSLPKNIFKKTTNLNLNYNNSTNTKSYYIESSQKNNNFIINKLNNKKNSIYLKKKESHGDNNNSYNNNRYIPFYNLLMEFIKQDNTIEITRQLLSLRDDINLTDLFELFDHSSKQVISSMDFLHTLKEFGLFLNKNEIKYLFRKFNKNINEFFDYEEFCEIFLPKKYSSAKIMSEKQTNEYASELTQETRKILCRLFNNIIEGEKSNENYRKIIGVNGECSGYDLFNKIKKNYSIGIYKEDISNFMKKNKHRLSNNEIELLMERFDKNKDGMIDRKEFLNEITPMD